jgi:hypothetical protein
MWRLTGVLAALVALAVLTMSHGTAAQAAAEKQLVCHVSGHGDEDSTGAGPARAHIIDVSVHAVPAHLRNHGDCLIRSQDRSLVGQPCDPTDADHDDFCDVQP